jgi:hypothetical protein
MVAEGTHVSAVHRPEVMIDRWRRQHERDRRAFERVHGRSPTTHYELAKWLAHNR